MVLHVCWAANNYIHYDLSHGYFHNVPIIHFLILLTTSTS